MNFSSFTGKSGRSRKVNLSGQQHHNPWGGSVWTSPSGASQSVHNAQVERQRRELEKRRLKATGDIQRIWRARCVRLELRRTRRQAIDALYQHPRSVGPTERLRRAFPLLLATFDPKSDNDIRRLLLFAEDATYTDIKFLTSTEVHPFRLRAFMHILVEALEREAAGGEHPVAVPERILQLVCRIVTASPQSLSTSLPTYYRILGQMCENENLSQECSELVAAAVLAPVASPSSEAGAVIEVYEAIALSFLTRPNLHLFEKDAARYSSALDPGKLALAIVSIYSDSSVAARSRTDLLWLLAHFIGLYQSWGMASQRPLLFRALYVQLSSLETEVSIRLSATAAPGSASRSKDTMDIDEPLLEPMAPYAADKLISLVDREGLSWVLRELSMNLGTSSNQDFENGSLMAGYILTLVRCFPHQSDEIRMRLFLSDITSPEGDLPAIKFLWLTMNHTKIYQEILSDANSPVRLLRSYLEYSKSSPEDASREQEWRAILLFLELYVFILRLSDDEDFFSGIYPDVLQEHIPSSRLRSCSLSMTDVKSLTVFLKNTAFALYYSATEIMKSQATTQASASRRLDAYLAAEEPPSPSQNRGAANIDAEIGTQPFISAAKLDFPGLRSVISTAMKMLYERDSRRSFLPPSHWLMTSKFDMEGFIAAVVAEEERQHELGDDSGDEESADEDDGDGWELSRIYTSSIGRLSRHAQIEKLRERQRKAQRERMLATIGPKLEILRNMPFIIPFDTRVQIFRQFVHQDKYRRREGHIDADRWRVSVVNGLMSNLPHRRDLGSHRARIRRGEVFNDAYEQFYELGDGLKEPIQITFVDQFDAEEAGIDGGGVTKEFLTSVTSEAFGQTDGLALFTASSKGLLYPNPRAMDERKELMSQAGIDKRSLQWQEGIQDLLRRYEFLGRIVGKCLYEGILVDITFAGFFLLKWSSGQRGENTYRGNVNDLRDMDEELYQGMLQLKNYDGNVADLSLDFTISDQVSVPGEPVRTITRSLIPNGEDTYVTNDNRLLYISYVARHRLVAQPAQQTAAFLRGLRSIIHPSWLSMFNQTELQRLVGGDSSEIDIEDLRRNTVYSGLYEIGDDGLEHPTIQLFWKVMGGFNDRQRRDLLKYVTSTPRAPLLGFAQLSPRFSIRDGGTDEERLPSTSTCVNLLKLPRYRKEGTLRSKLLYAISSGAGFDLS